MTGVGLTAMPVNEREVKHGDGTGSGSGHGPRSRSRHPVTTVRMTPPMFSGAVEQRRSRGP